ncbi:proline-rich protein 15 [Dermochelys coriacea]|uniref:proline-rich protein 15 n=1 Tax=Dermochelys coriacea TaxID=27794 RepID=UPI0018E73226|nr:proline-rich protein 15 [Dermochelys coriacea]XP_043365055.1 proline-rich protein 15 [Dermochelys coriacea]
MADSTATTGSLWKALTRSRKKAKEGLVAGAPPPPPEPALPPAPPGPDSRENQQPNFSSSEPKLGEKPGGGSRRNLKISRSGRFKEKLKVRAPLLAESPKLFEGSAPSHASEERQ